MHVARGRPPTREELGAALARRGRGRHAGALSRRRHQARLGAGRRRRRRSSSPRTGSNAIVEHNAGDLTAVLEAGRAARRRAGARSPRRARCSRSTRRTAAPPSAASWRPPTPVRCAPATAAPRDLVVGMRVALSDGTLAKSGGKVIKNVAGYDLAKLFAGSFGTLGAIVEVSVRLHPLPPATATAVGARARARTSSRAARAALAARAARAARASTCAGTPAAGTVLARFARRGRRARRPRRPSGCCARRGLATEIVDDDEPLWDEQRAAQRGPLVVKVSAPPDATCRELAARGRASSAPRWWAAPALGLSWLRLEEPTAAAVERLRRDFAIAVVLDRPADLDVDPSGRVDPAAARADAAREGALRPRRECACERLRRHARARSST